MYIYQYNHEALRTQPRTVVDSSDLKLSNIDSWLNFGNHRRVIDLDTLEMRRQVDNKLLGG